MIMAEHDEGFVLTTVDSITNFVRQKIAAPMIDSKPVQFGVNWARKSAIWPMTRCCCTIGRWRSAGRTPATTIDVGVRRQSPSRSQQDLIIIGQIADLRAQLTPNWTGFESIIGAAIFCRTKIRDRINRG